MREPTSEDLLNKEENCLFFLPDYTYFKVSSSVGSGKTLAAISYMLSEDKSTTNFLYVAPTINLVTQTHKGLQSAISKSNSTKRNPKLIHSVNISERQSASQVAIAAINDAIENTGTTIIVTTITFLNILPLIKKKHNWSVIMDEAFSPLSFVTYQLGSRDEDREKSKEYFSNLFAISDNEEKSISVTKGQSSLVNAVASNNWQEAGSMYSGMQDLAKAVVNSALKVELTEQRKDRYTFATWVTADYFNGFLECIFLAALFEQTILHHLWTSEYQATFRSHKFFSSEINIDIHATQGRLVSVGHLLHPDDHASKYNLQRSHKTGASEAEHGVRVIDKCIEIIQAHFSGKAVLLQINRWAGYGKSLPVNKGVTIIPTMSQGMNHYQDHTAIAALAVTNPEPHMCRWFKQRTSLSDSKLYQAFRIHNVYQACGRTAVRDWGNQEQAVFLVTGKEDAEFLHNLFIGSNWLGQVGDIPSLKPLKKENSNTIKKKPTLANNKEYQDLRGQYKSLSNKKSRAKRAGRSLSNADHLKLLSTKKAIVALRRKLKDK